MVKRRTKCIGILKSNVAIELGVSQHSNKDIIQSTSLFKHILKHVP